MLRTTVEAFDLIWKAMGRLGLRVDNHAKRLGKLEALNVIPGRVINFGDDIAQHVKDQARRKAAYEHSAAGARLQQEQEHRESGSAGPDPGPGVSSLLYVEPCIHPFRYGQRVENTVTKAFGDKVALREWTPGWEALLRRISLMSRGIVIPRPDGCPMLRNDRLQMYVLCDDGKVRSTRATFLK